MKSRSIITILSAALFLVLLTHSSAPTAVWYFGGPSSRRISAASSLTNTVGTLFGSSFLPGRAAFTSFQLSSAGSFEKLGGSAAAGVHGPARSFAWSQEVS